MAVTNGWGQGVINNTNGFGKLATNNIGAGSIYEDSYTGDTALIGVTISAAFSYSASSFTQADSNPTPTITGTTGGTFSGTSGLVFVSTSTGQIDLSASTIAAHVVTYTVDGVSATFNLSVTAAPYASTSSFTFDGANDYFSAPINTLNSATVCSISFWGKKNSSSVNLNVGGYITGSQGIWIMWYLDGNIYFSPRGTGATGFGLTHSQSYDNDWHHYVGVYDGTSAANCKLYLDGNLVATGTGTPPSSLPSTTGDVFQIGALGTSFYTTGNIDEVAFFNYAIDSDQILEIYNATSTGKTADLSTMATPPVAWYRMGD